MEALSEVTKSYLPLPPASNTPLELDRTVPPFWNLIPSATILLVVYLDTARPLSEPKWAKTGDIQDWLKSMFGRMFWVAGDAAEGWEKKIVVVDPDPVGFLSPRYKAFMLTRLICSLRQFGLSLRVGL